MGLAIVTGRLPMKDSTGQTAPQEIQLFGWVFVIIAAMLILGGLTMAGFMAYAGRCIASAGATCCADRGGISCSFMPFGTVLGVFTLVTLLRPQVKALFGVGNAAA